MFSGETLIWIIAAAAAAVLAIYVFSVRDLPMLRLLLPKEDMEERLARLREEHSRNERQMEQKRLASYRDRDDSDNTLRRQ